MTGGLECYSCTEEGDAGCSADKIVKVSCAQAMNVCMDYTHTIKTDALNMTIRKKGCSSGLTKTYDSEGSFVQHCYVTHINACNTSLCNNDLTNAIRPRLCTIASDVPNGMECYACLSFSKDQCSPKYAEKIKCTGYNTNCYKENQTVSLGNDYSSRTIYIETCSQDGSCSRSYSSTNMHMKIKGKGSCCSGKFCNKAHVFFSSVSHFFLLLGMLIVTVLL
ncbi:ly6/PLAUR domain-containing protein 3-like isoform X2 [Microcaecilia unicolor]|uniref:Ly6/PLAUR domain-containing protein 3-like isoform X2 n=1 Tax=Microcaecilia unicolor TaxID=1415580 RepID=A0A6P7YQ12_9AMPH|nr:ly6/PLAUR domain-containing protein 3-like isoform X2 [Microcaecilia unicolor]